MRKLLLWLCCLFLLFCVMATWNGMSGSRKVSFTVATPQVTPHVTRINQLDCGQYASLQECRIWSPSSCSATSMAEAMNAFGYAYRVGDVLKVEAAFSNPQVISPTEGLLYTGGIDRTLRSFGFQARQLQHPTIAQVVAEAQRAPVIVNFPPSRWSGGHFLIVTGGNERQVSLADSSSYNLPSMTVATFHKYWAGFAVVVTPQQGG